METKQVNVRLDTNDITMLEIVAERMKTNRSSLIRMIAHEWLSENGYAEGGFKVQAKPPVRGRIIERS